MKCCLLAVQYTPNTPYSPYSPNTPYSVSYNPLHPLLLVACRACMSALRAPPFPFAKVPTPVLCAAAVLAGPGNDWSMVGLPRTCTHAHSCCQPRMLAILLPNEQ